MSIQITTIICTFRRDSLLQTLQSISQITLPEGISFKVVVVDNDDQPSAKDKVLSVALPWPLEDIHAPARNISLARNAGLNSAQASNWVAYVDDDETVSPDWLKELWSVAQSQDADVVLGPALAVYPDYTPTWMVELDLHSSKPVLKASPPHTGHTCNVLFKWSGTPWQDTRFELARGLTGGEDTAFFFELSKLGAKFAIADRAEAFEVVEDRRMSFNWLARRKFRMGQSYSTVAHGTISRVKLGGLAAIKCVASFSMYCLNIGREVRRNFWLLRAIFHAGVVGGCLNLSQQKLYEAPN